MPSEDLEHIIVRKDRPRHSTGGGFFSSLQALRTRPRLRDLSKPQRYEPQRGTSELERPLAVLRFGPSCRQRPRTSARPAPSPAPPTSPSPAVAPAGAGIREKGIADRARRRSGGSVGASRARGGDRAGERGGSERWRDGWRLATTPNLAARPATPSPAAAGGAPSRARRNEERG